jgi:hypothetical protein
MIEQRLLKKVAELYRINGGEKELPPWAGEDKKNFLDLENLT